MRKIKTVIIGLGRIGFEYSKTTKNNKNTKNQ